MFYNNDMFDPDFDHVYAINGRGYIFEPPMTVYSPDVEFNPDTRDAESTWDILSGHSGQWQYDGNVMHPSEQWGDWAVNALSELAGDSILLFTVLVVQYEDDAIGWCVAYSEIDNKQG